MPIRTTVLAFTIGTAALCGPLQAGGPVIVDDPEVAAPQGHSLKDALPLILLGLVAIAVIGGGSDNCLSEEPDGGCE